MDRVSDGHSEERRPTSCLVEEEYTIAIPLVRPKAPFLQFLHHAGASCEVFTKKEILQYLRKYIVSRKLFDEQNPRTVHCKNDPLGEVFGVDQFTIDDVLDLLARHCIQLPDTKLKRQRRLVSKPAVTISCNGTPGSSFTISVCRASSETSCPVISSTSGNRLSSQKYALSPSTNRKSSSSSNCDTADSTDSSYKKTKHKGRKLSVGNIQNFAVVKDETLPQDSANQDRDNPEGTISTQNSDSLEEESKVKNAKRKDESNHANSSSRKRHKTEPSTVPGPYTSDYTQPSSSELSRRRSTSFSIHYGKEDAKGDYPWYFQLNVDGDSDEESEVLSVQGKETVIVEDSTDDLWFLEEESISVEVQSDTDFSVEYDIESDIAPLTESDISSVRSGTGLLVVCQESDVEFFADCSETDSNDGDKELTPEDNWCCAECNYSNTPFQRYCSRCWKLRADWLPTDDDRTENSHGKLQNNAKDASEACGDIETLQKERKDSSNVRTGRTDSVTLSKYLDPCIVSKDYLASDITSKENIDSGVGSFSSTQTSSQETVTSKINDHVFLGSKAAEKCKQVSHNLNVCESLPKEAERMETRYTFSNAQLKQKCSDGRSSCTQNAASRTGSDCSSPDSDSTKTKLISVTKSSSVEDPCMICLTKTKNASLIHGSSGHQVCCFACAKRLKRRGKLCPVCRRPIQKVVKNYIL